MAIRMNKDGYYIKCDKCGVTQRLPKRLQTSITRTDQYFYQEARHILRSEYMWVNDSEDFCPECNPDIMSRDLSVSESSFTGKLITVWVISQLTRDLPDYLQFIANKLNKQYWVNDSPLSPPSPDVYYFVRENRYEFFLIRDQERSPRKVVA